MVENDALQALMEGVERTLTGLENLPSEPLPVAAAARIAVEFDEVATQAESRLSVTSANDEPVTTALRAARASLGAEGFDAQIAHDRFVELLGSVRDRRRRRMKQSVASLWKDAIPEQLTRPARHRAVDPV